MASVMDIALTVTAGMQTQAVSNTEPDPIRMLNRKTGAWLTLVIAQIITIKGTPAELRTNERTKWAMRAGLV